MRRFVRRSCATALGEALALVSTVVWAMPIKTRFPGTRRSTFWYRI